MSLDMTFHPLYESSVFWTGWPSFISRIIDILKQQIDEEQVQCLWLMLSKGGFWHWPLTSLDNKSIQEKHNPKYRTMQLTTNLKVFKNAANVETMPAHFYRSDFFFNQNKIVFKILEPRRKGSENHVMTNMKSIQWPSFAQSITVM